MNTVQQDGRAVADTHSGIDSATMSEAYRAAFVRLIAANEKVVAVETDSEAELIGPDLLSELLARHPGQVVQCGLQEAGAVGVAAGLSIVGRIPFIHARAASIARRSADQVFAAGCYNRANVRIVASDPGVTAGFGGGTQMTFEDVGIFRSFPGMTVVEPSDGTLLTWLVPELAKRHGMFYLRVFRGAAPRLYGTGESFTLGRAKRLREGADVTIIAAGIMVGEAVEAARRLEAEDGVTVRVLDMFTIKPLDENAVVRAAKDTGAIVTAENHTRMGGLGSGVAEVLAATVQTPLEMVGVRDIFGEVGSLEYLMKRFGLTANDIVAAVKKVLQRKAG